MKRIILSRTCPDLNIEGRAFAIVGKGWRAPKGMETVDLDAFLASPSRYLAEPATMAVIGLSDILTPSNRVKVGQAILRPWPGLQRVVVDRALFTVEPWRAWWAFRAVLAPYEDYPDSYLAETRWRFAQEKQTPDPFSLEALCRWGADVVAAPDPLRFGPLIEDVVETSEDARAEYAALKAEVFEQETTLAAILRRLSAFAEELEPRREIPTPAGLFRDKARHLTLPPVRVVRTDLGVDRYLADQLRYVVALTNGIANHFGEASCT